MSWLREVMDFFALKADQHYILQQFLQPLIPYSQIENEFMAVLGLVPPENYNCSGPQKNDTFTYS